MNSNGSMIQVCIGLWLAAVTINAPPLNAQVLEPSAPAPTGWLEAPVEVPVAGPTTRAPDNLPRALANPNLNLRGHALVSVSIPTPDGGAIVAGGFSYLGGDSIPRQGIARILADGSIDNNWNVTAYNVSDMEISGDWLYLAGYLGQVNGQTRRGLARVSLSTGILDSWNPNAAATDYPNVYSMALIGNEVYVGGSFASFGGAPRSNLAKINAAGSLDATWQPATNGRVESLSVDGSSVFASGAFTTVNGLARSNAVKLAATGAGDVDASWAPVFNANIYRTVVDGGFLYATGCFSQVNSTNRNFLARVSTSGTGTLDASWNPSPNGGCTLGLSVSNNHVYAAGAFTQVGGLPLSRIARMSKVGAGAPDPSWAPSSDGVFTYTLTETASGNVLLGGDFVKMSGQFHPGLVRVSANGTPLTPNLWSESNGYVNAALTLPDQSVMLGGYFIRVDSIQRTGLLKLDPTGALNSGFDALLPSTVNALELDGNSIYAAVNNNQIRKLDVNTAASDPSWSPVQTSSSVYALELDSTNGFVYLGGYFQNVNSQVRNRIARVARTSGSLDAWNPNANDVVRALALDGAGSIFAGGSFTNINGVARARLAKLSTAAGATVDPGFSADANSDVRALLMGPSNTLYVGGTFTSISGLGRPGFVRLTTTTGAPDPSWNTFLQSFYVYALQNAPGGLYVGGNYYDIGGQPRTQIARVSHAGVVADLFAPNLNGAVLAIAAGNIRVTLGGTFTLSGPDTRIGAAAFDLNATPVVTTTTITEDAPENSLANQYYRVSVSVGSPEGPPPTNTMIEIGDDRGNACTAFLNSAGSGSCELVGRDVGTRTLTARFAGTPLYNASIGTETHLVAGSNPNPPVNTSIELRSAGAVRDAVRLSDGSVVIAGSFNRIGSTTRRGLAKILPDGSLDPSFAPALIGTPYALARDANDNIFVTGSFGYIGSTLRRNLAKLAPNGTVLAGWAPGETCIGSGRIAVGGNGDLYVPGCTRFVSVPAPGTSYYRTDIVRLNGSTGALTPGFSAHVAVPNTSTFPSIAELEVTADAIYAGGSFLLANGSDRTNLVKLGLDGTVVSTWNPAPNAGVNALLVAGSDVYVGGNFTQIGGQALSFLARLDATGAPVASFSPAANGSISGLALDGSELYVTGFFSNIGGLARSSLAKLNPGSGAADPGFQTSPDSTVTAVLVSGSSLYLGGFFTQVNAEERIGLARLNAMNGANLPSPLSTRQPLITALARQPDGATLIGGGFVRPGSTMRNLVRVAPSGAFDLAYNPAPNGQIGAIVVGATGESYVSGLFSTIGGLSRTGLARLNLDGSADPGFNATLNCRTSGPALYLAPDGLVVGGCFTSINSVARNRLAKVSLTTGTVDPIWDPNAGSSVSAIAADATGSLYVGGSFATMGGLARNRLAKISGSGTGAVDSNWVADANSTVRALLVASDQSLYAGGFFSTIAGATRRGLAKLSTTAPAALSTWNPAGNYFNTIYALAEGQDGSIYAGGSFLNSGGLYRSNAVKLSPTTAQADPGWNPSFDAPVYALLVGYGPTQVAVRNPMVEQNIAFGGDFEFSGATEIPGFAAINSVSVPSDALFCAGFENGSCGF